MAPKVTPLYAETLVLLWLWAFDDTPASRSKFITTSTQAYKTALEKLVEAGAIKSTPKNKRTDLYNITSTGITQLTSQLANKDFAFQANLGARTANALLHWIRQADQQGNAVVTTGDKAKANGNGGVTINSYETFTDQALEVYERLNQDYNLDNLVPIYRIRRELGDRLTRHDFNEWLLEVQANDLVQLMGGDLPNVTPDQLEDSVAIPGGGTRFYVKRL